MIQYENGVGGKISSKKGSSIMKMKMATTPVKKLNNIGGHDTKFLENI